MAVMAELRLGVLGALQVVVDGEERPVPPGRQRAVLARLLVDADQPVSGDALVEAAWPDMSPEDPRRALRTVLSRLRSVLGSDRIIREPTGYRLAVPPSAVDAGEFEQLVEDARQTGATRAEHLLRRALSLWRGPPYGEYDTAWFAASEKQRLERLRADALEAHATVLLHTGDPAAAVADLEGLLERDPFREQAVELLARALYEAGRQTEALDRLRAHRRRLVSELGLDPGPALIALEQRILGHSLPPSPALPRLPDWLDTSTAFIGREDEVAAVVGALAAHSVTVITGPGGVGKSRLAAEALVRADERLELPVTVVELVSVTGRGVVAAVADALGLRSQGSSLQESVVEYLGASPHLLVLDNCEHVRDQVAPLVDQIVRRCRDVRVLATSRRRLGILSELVIPLDPLALPDPAATVGVQSAAASVRLLADRVRRLRPTFAVTPENTPQVAQLCRRCDGLPLAVELAASRVANSGVDEVVRQLSDPGPGGAADALDAVVEWSVRLLEPQQRELLHCLAVFAGSFDTDDARRMAERLPWDHDVGAALPELVESCLVVAHLSGGTCRHHLLEMVRAHAARGLAASGREDVARRAHAEWVRDTVAAIRADWSRGDGADAAARLDACSAEVANALRHVLDSGDLVLGADLSHAVGRCLHWTPRLELADLLLELGRRGARDGRPALAPALGVAAFLAAERGELDRARSLGTTALTMSRVPDDLVMVWLALAVSAMYAGDLIESARWFRKLATLPEFTGEAHSSLALIACYRDELAAAGEHARIALAARPTSSDATHAFARYAAGEVAARDDPARGEALLAGAAEEARRVGAEQVHRVARVARFALLVRGGRLTEAAELGLPLVRELRRRGNWNQAWTMMRLVAELLVGVERWPDAAYLLAAAREAPSAPPPVGQDIARYDAMWRAIEQALGSTVVRQIGVLAARDPRGQVVSRAERALSEVALA